MKNMTLFTFAASLVFCSSTFAVNLGNIEVASAFREPLNANIPIINTEGSDITKVMLAENYAYLNARLNKQEALDSVNSALTQDDSGNYFVSLSSNQPINELFLELIVDVSTENEKLSRKYTVLLDPIDYQSKLSSVKKVVPKRKLTKVEPVVIKEESHSMESSIGEGSHDMKGSVEESHSMESSIGEGSHDMKGSVEESHSMESSIGEGSHDMKGSVEESHSMESSIGEGSHDMKGSVEESHSMESSIGEGSHDMKGSVEESHSMESSIGEGSHDMKGSVEESHSMESSIGEGSHDMKGSVEESHSMESSIGEGSHDMKGSVH